MKVAIFINTPAQFHFWRPIAAELARRGHGTEFLARDYGETRRLVEETGTPAWTYSRAPRTKLGKIVALPLEVRRAWAHLRKDKPDVLAGFGLYEAFVGRLLGRPAVTFTDSEPSCNSRGYAVQYKAYLPFVHEVVTPSWFRDNLGKKQVRVASLKELAYLHPARFRGTAAPPSSLKLDAQQRYCVVRLNAFDAVHDAGIRGFTGDGLRGLVERLGRHGKVFVSNEGKMPAGLEGLQLPSKKSEIHAVLEHASLLVTDTQTMATEAVLLGVPTVRCNGFVGVNDMGVFQKLEAKGMMWNFRHHAEAAEQAERLLADPAAKGVARANAAAFMAEAVDIVPFMADRLVAAGGA